MFGVGTGKHQKTDHITKSWPNMYICDYEKGRLFLLSVPLINYTWKNGS